MRSIGDPALAVVALLVAGALTSAHAVPTLQLGICADASCSNYVQNDTIGSDEDTAFTTDDPFTLLVAGVQSRNDVVQLGGQYSDTIGSETYTGADWSDFGFSDVFDGHGAILVVSAPDGEFLDLSNSPLTVNNVSPFFFSTTDSYLQGNHFPAKSAVADFFFFDLGDIFGPLTWELDSNKIEVETSTLQSSIPNFQGSTDTSNNVGKMLSLTVDVVDTDVSWLHFDVLALQTFVDVQTNRGVKTAVVDTSDTSVQGNPYSKDVTWYREEGGGPPEFFVPEPNILWLLVGGLAAFRVGRPYLG